MNVMLMIYEIIVTFFETVESMFIYSFCSYDFHHTVSILIEIDNDANENVLIWSVYQVNVSPISWRASVPIKNSLPIFHLPSLSLIGEFDGTFYSNQGIGSYLFFCFIVNLLKYS